MTLVAISALNPDHVPEGKLRIMTSSASSTGELSILLASASLNSIPSNLSGNRCTNPASISLPASSAENVSGELSMKCLSPISFLASMQNEITSSEDTSPNKPRYSSTSGSLSAATNLLTISREP